MELLNNSQIGSTVTGCRYDPGYMRPYIETNPNSPLRGRPCVTVNTGRMVYNNATGIYVPEYRKYSIADLQARGINSPVFNATSLRKEEWIMMDRQVIREARFRMRAWGDLASANTFGGFNGMSKLILEHETMTDAGRAVVDMDALTDANTNDSPKFQLEGLPLPITHSDFWFSERRLAVSRNSGTPLDTTMGEMAGRRVGELVEKTTIGVETGLTYGGNSTQVGGYGRASSVYGYLNFPNRLTKTNLTVPTGSNPEVTIADILAMRQQMYDAKFYGPFILYHSTDWDLFLDNDYARLGGNNSNQTLRDRIRAIEGIQDVRRLDFLRPTATATGDPADISATHAYTLIMVQMTADVARAVVGMDITTVQWESRGGMQKNFKVMCILVPQLRATYAGNCGILQATTP